MNVIEKATAYPSRYAWQLEEKEFEEQWREAAAGKFWMRAEGYRKEEPEKRTGTKARREAALVVSGALGKGAQYHRKENYYGIGDWIVTDHAITSGLFGIGGQGESLRVFAELDQAGYRAEDGLSVFYRARSAGKKEMLVLMILAGREMKKLGEKMGLSDEPEISIEGEGFLQFYIPWMKLEYEKLDACLRLYHRMIKAAGIR